MLNKLVRCRECKTAFRAASTPTSSKPVEEEEIPTVAPADTPDETPARLTERRSSDRASRSSRRDEEREPERRERRDRRERPARSRSAGSSGLIIYAVVGGVLLLLAGGVVAWLALAESPAPRKEPVAQANPAPANPAPEKNQQGPKDRINEPDKNLVNRDRNDTDKKMVNRDKDRIDPPKSKNKDQGEKKPPIIIPDKNPPPVVFDAEKPNPPVKPVLPPEPRPEPAQPVILAPVPGATDAAGDKLANKFGKNVKQLPSTFSDVALGGGGRFIILHLPQERKLAIFDTSTAEIAKYLPVAEDKVLFAANLDKLIVYLPGANVFQRYNLNTFEREATVPSPITATVAKMLMGSASRGPLVVFCTGRAFGNSEAGVLDPVTLKPLDVQLNGGRDSTWRISGDGRLLASFQPSTSPQGHQLHLRQGDEFKRSGLEGDPNFAGHIIPGPEGRNVYTARGIFTNAGKPLGKLGSYNDGSRFCVPCAENETFYLRIDVPGFPHGARNQVTGPAYLHLAGDDRPIAKLDGVETIKGLNTWSRDAFGHDRRFYLVPSAKLLVVLPDTQDRLDLYRVDTEELLSLCDHDFIAVLSSPPRVAVRGQTFTYTPNAKAKKGAVTVKLESGPTGMKIAPNGKLTWDVPANFDEQQADVILTVASAGGQEIFHSFSLTILDKNDPQAPKGVDQPKPPEDKQPEVKPEVKPEGKPENPPAAEAPQLGGIKPAVLKAEREERELPGSIDDVCVGGAGRFIILHLGKERKLAIFDANEAKIVKYLPLAEDKVVFTAGLDKLIVAYPGTGVFQRWSLTTFEKEATVPSPVQKTIGSVVMGSASNGPLLLCLDSGNRFGQEAPAVFLDPKTFRPIDMNWTQGRMPSNAPELVRASADGTLFGMRTGRGSEGHEMAIILVNGNQASSMTTGDMEASLIMPSTNGRFLYTSEGVFNSSLQRVHPKTRERDQAAQFVPARHGDLFLLLQPVGERFGIPGQRQDLKGTLSILLPGQTRPVAALRDIEGVAFENLNYGGNPANKMHHDKRIHLIPDARLLVTIPNTNDRLILRKFDLDDLLAKSEVDYLFVTSQPPLAVKPGEKLTYQVAVKSKKGGVKYKVEAGPAGMAISATGQLTWSVPANFDEKSTDVILTVSDSTGQEIFHTFSLATQPK
jgi:hypothetical protein